MQNWKVNTPINDDIKTKFPDIDPVILELLWQRGLHVKKEMDLFLHPDYKNLHDSFLFRDMAKFITRLRQALEKTETVCVYGDYDSDGVCSSVLMVEALRAIGINNVFVYIPHREKEGYGLNKEAINFIKRQNTNLIITVDCGSSNVEEVAHARSLGLDIIIIDHHEEPPQLPQGLVAFLNPHLSGETYPFRELAAVGVAFKAVQAIWQSFNLPIGHERWLLDIVAIATITDMMPLIDENRIFVHFGLLVLNKTRRPGLQALLKSIGNENNLGVYDIGFKIGPRLNAAGRIDHANAAYELLIEKDSNIANDFAQSLSTTNTERQGETERILRAALEQVAAQVRDNLVLTAIGDDWQVGVVGLVSGKITEKYHRPSLVMTRTTKGVVGSGRSINGFNITAALAKERQFLERFGGHAGACGFTLKDEALLPEFQKALNFIAQQELSDDDLLKTLKIDLEIKLNQINWILVNTLTALAPFGMGNPRPKFLSTKVGVREAYVIGDDGKHLRLALEQNNIIFEAVSFGSGEEWGNKLKPGDYIDIAYEIDINEWKGNKKIQLKIQDIKKA